MPASIDITLPGNDTLLLIAHTVEGLYVNWITGVLEAFNTSGTKSDYYKASTSALNIATTGTRTVTKWDFDLTTLNGKTKLLFDIIASVSQAIVGSGEINLDGNGDEWDAVDYARVAAAGNAGNVTGAGTGTEEFNNLDGTPGFTSTVDLSGNRSIVVH